MALIFNELTKSLGAKEYFSWPPVLECPWVSAHLASELLGCWVAGLLAIWQPGSWPALFCAQLGQQTSAFVIWACLLLLVCQAVALVYCAWVGALCHADYLCFICLCHWLSPLSK